MINDFSEYITDCVRILVILASTKKYKSIKLTENKIKLYDYYFKFPYTMLGNKVENFGVDMTVEEFYSFFHCQPDIIKYRQIINYLISKGFIQCIDNNGTIFSITETGEAVLDEIKNPYKERLIVMSDIIVDTLKNMSDTKINEEIQSKNNILSRKELENIWEKNLVLNHLCW